ncbi:hypothetical protein OAP05_04740 [Schleiferiaceae bacterium]|nr:hypothetical protein [Schleiferiaceae bacterium]
MKRIITLLFFLVVNATFSQELTTRSFFKTKTPNATYERFHYLLDGHLLLEEQFLQVRDASGEVLKSQTTLNFTKRTRLPDEVTSSIIYHDDKWVSVSPDTLLDGPIHAIRYFTLDGTLLLERDLTVHFNDTTVPVRVFNPDPLTPYNLTYGGIYKDLNDANGTVLDSLTIIDTLTVDKIADTTFLRNGYIEIVDFDAPYISPSTSPQDWTGGRTAPEFEQVMCVYHISALSRYLNTLGYGAIMTYVIQADAQALNGQDNSMFNFGYSPPRLYFGEGGVDDAEDADVIIHEFGHAISHGAAPGTNFGMQRRSFDEAFGDYLAERHGRRLGISSTRVFDWDGNNEFWNGRSVSYDGVKNYDQLIFNSIYQHTDIMSSAMLEFSANPSVGGLIADKIILEGVHSIMPNQTLRQIAQNFIFADSLLHNGLHFNAITLAFGAPKNILAANSIDEPSVFVQTEHIARTEFGSVLKTIEGRTAVICHYNWSGQLLWSKSTTGVLVLPVSTSGILEIQYDTGERIVIKTN